MSRRTSMRSIISRNAKFQIHFGRNQFGHFADLHVGDWFVVMSGRHLLIAATLVLFLVAFASVAASTSAEPTQAKTTKDKVYSKEQAARGGARLNNASPRRDDAAHESAE